MRPLSLLCTMHKPLEGRQVLKLGAQVVEEGDGDPLHSQEVLPLLPPAVLRLEPHPGPAGRPRLLLTLAALAALVGLGFPAFHFVILFVPLPAIYENFV